MILWKMCPAWTAKLRPSLILSKVRPLSEKLFNDRDAWIKPERYEVDKLRGVSQYVLHEKDDHNLIFAACFKPGRVTPVHDHGTWAVFAGVDGGEKNAIYKRTDNAFEPNYGEI